MTIRFILSKLTLVFIAATCFVACGQVPTDQAHSKNPITKTENLSYDTSKTAIIEFNEKDHWPFDSTFNAAVLNQSELNTVDSILLVSVANYNTSVVSSHKQWNIDLNRKNYRKQLVVVTNKFGQKEVWVNCFCWIDNDKWKTRIFSVHDGGNCYFNFKINLTTKTYDDFSVNGAA